MLANYRRAGEITSLSRSQIERLVIAGKFPQPVQITDKRVGFVESELRAWVECRILDRDAAPRRAA